MIIGGIQRVSFIDYPGKISCVIFARGCNFRCFYCHNPELIYPELFKDTVSLVSLLGFLRERKGKIDAVVLSGGEPTIQDDLPEFLESIRNEGFLVKLDTNGSRPEILKQIVDRKLVDYIAMDIKTSFFKYSLVTLTNVDTDKIRESIKIIINSGLNYEFRTTWDKKIIDNPEIEEIRSYLNPESTYVLHDMNRY